MARGNRGSAATPHLSGAAKDIASALLPLPPGFTEMGQSSGPSLIAHWREHPLLKLGSWESIL